MHNWYGSGVCAIGQWSWGGPMMIFGVLLLVGIGVLIYLSAKNRSGGSLRSKDDAIEILKARYARGEVSREEYQSIIKDLNS